MIRIRLVIALLAWVLSLGACAAEESPLSKEHAGHAERAGAPEVPTASRSSASPSSAENLYTCGMHPHVVQEGPGTCPICGMELVPIAAPSSGITIDAAMAQNMNVRVEPARRQTVFRHVRTIGEVEVGEDRISVVNLRYSGWAERVHVARTGDPVRAGDPLFDLYSPELVAAQRELLLAVRTHGPESDLARSARRKFELWGVDREDVARIERTGETLRTLPIRSPHGGFVLEKRVVDGARVSAGEDLYRIGDLARIWVTAKVYEFDAPWVEVGQPAQLELPYQEGRVIEGKVSYIYPTLDASSRTLTVRLEFENPDIRLKPGMFATVYIQYRRAENVLALPTEAILDSGRRKLVFVESSPGRFEPREIVTGLVGDHHMTEVLSGLEEGALVAVSGQFLLDSESQLQEAIRKMRGGPNGHEGHGMSGPSPSVEAASDEVVYACPMHPDITSHEPGRCSECGMFLERVETTPETRP